MSDDLFFNLPLDFGFAEQTFNFDDIIRFKKILSNFAVNIQDSLPKECPICHRQIISRCNSHSIPRFCLKHITQQGMVINPSFIFNAPIFETQTGISKTGTFHLICPQCDHTVFSEYENPENYNRIPSPKMLAQIAMKTSLKSIYKRIVEINYYEHMQTHLPVIFNPLFFNYLKDAIETSHRDLKDFNKDFSYAQKALSNSINKGFKLHYYQKLNYVIPLAAQIEIVIISDLEGNIINNIYDKSLSYNLQPLHVCLFPLSDCSVIFMFTKEDHTKLRRFFKKFNTLPVAEQLNIISFLIFLYSEDVYINKSIQEELRKHESVKNTINTSSMSLGISDNPKKVSPVKKINSIKNTYDLNQYKTFPNLLSEQFKASLSS